MDFSPSPAEVRYFEEQATAPVTLLGQGMEGAVYDLGGGMVGKVWFDRTAAEVLPLQAFFAELNQQDLPFLTPHLTAVDSVDGRAVSIERKLTGTPLRQVLESGAMSQQQGLDLFVEVVTALGRTTAGPAAKALPLLGERPAKPEWGEAMAELTQQRASKSSEYLAADVDGFDELLERVLAGLSAVQLDTPQIVHGDLCTPNILIGDHSQIALLDWGFFTTAGDNTFDAATAAGFYDMYGPSARAIDDLLLDRFEELGHSRDRMYLYRAAYAICTATIYSPTAADGHYTWCVENLRRKELRAAL
jgi:aminoglycoside phosphotransferase (APT) family kinase protein